MSTSRMFSRPLQVAAVLGVLAAPVAGASDSGFYIDTGIGIADHPNRGGLTLDETTLTGKTDTSDQPTFRLGGGYRVNRYFAIEAAYVDLGEVSGRLSSAADQPAAQADVDFSMRGVTVAAVATLPLGNWQPYLKVGVIFSRTELSIAGDIEGRPLAQSISGDSTDRFAGLGVGYELDEHWRATLDAAAFHDVGERHESGASNAEAVTVGLTYSF